MTQQWGEHYLFIAHQAAADVLWDCVRPSLLATDDATRHLHGFIRLAMMTGTLAARLSHANLVIQHMRQHGLL